MNFQKDDWQGVSTTSLADALQGVGTMNSHIKPLNKYMRMVGPAFTVQIIKNDCAVVFKALHDAAPGEVLVIDTDGSADVAFLGEIVVHIAQKRGLAGIVIDGCIRDSLDISEGSFPVFAKGAVPKIPAAVYLGKTQQVIQCGGVVVKPGMIIYGDADGVVVVPEEKQIDVVKNAKSKEAADRWKLTRMIPDSDMLQKFLDEQCVHE